MKIKINIDNEEKEIDYEELADYENYDIHFVKNNKSKITNLNQLKAKIVGATPLIVTCLYLLIGFCYNIWHPTWLLFLLIPIVPIVLYSFGNLRKNLHSIVVLLVIVIYFIIGFLGYWHPGWLIFFLIPITSIFIES